MNEISFDVLIGKTLTKVEVIDSEVFRFTTTEGVVYLLYHRQDCCESVTVEDVCGDLADLVGTPILEASEETSDHSPDEKGDRDRNDSQTWTFYKLGTIKGRVTIRWYGTSNGYYSESVDFVRCGDE